MRQSIKIFILIFTVFFGWQKIAHCQKVPPLKMTAVRAECKRIGIQSKMVLTITLDNYSYSNFGTNIQYIVTDGTNTQTLMASAANTATPNIHEFTGVNLTVNTNYSITANAPPVGGNTLTFTPLKGNCFIQTQVVIDSALVVQVSTEKKCPTLVNLVSNGNFMYGNNGSFKSDLVPGCNSCTTGSYCVDKEFKAKCNTWPAATWDHTLGTASGSYLLVDGHQQTASTVWFTDVKVCKDMTYTFSFWAKSLYSDAFTLGFMVNGVLAPVTGSTVAISGTPAWREYSISWPCNLPTGTIVQIGIEQLTGGDRRDFGIDDIFFGYCCNECNISTSIEEDCVIDIDTTIVKVSCGNIVNISSIFDGTPSLVTCTVYDSIGNIVFTALNTPTLTFTLPGTGIFYGVVEASCGGGDANGGDEDEDVFEIINLAPVADFRLSSTFNCVAGQPQRSVATLDYSNQEGTLSYLYKVTDVLGGTSSTYTSAQPFFTVDAKKAYDVNLTVTDSKGCTAQKTVRVDAAATCNAKFDWWYSWCEDQCTGTKKLPLILKTSQSLQIVPLHQRINGIMATEQPVLLRTMCMTCLVMEKAIL